MKAQHLKPVSEIFNKIKNDKNKITSISIGKDYIEKAKEFSKLLVEKGIISKKDYNNNNLSLEENKYNNSVQGKFAEMAFYDFLKSKNIADKKDFNKNEYKVDFYGFIDRYKIKTLIKEGKIKTIHNSKNNEFCLIPWKYMKPITEIYK